MNSKKHPAVIICGGSARRFGSNKILATLAGRPVLAHVMARVRPQVLDMAINGPQDVYGAFGLPVLGDDFPDAGPLAGILAAMDWAAAQGKDAVLTVAGDTPFVPQGWAARLDHAAMEAICVPRVDGRAHYLSGLLPVGLAGDLRAVLEQGQNRRVQDFIATHTHAFVDFDVAHGVDPFFNVNRPEDLVKAEAILGLNRP